MWAVIVTPLDYIPMISGRMYIEEGKYSLHAKSCCSLQQLQICQAEEESMAFHQLILFFTIIFLWHVLTNAQDSLENRDSYYSPGKSRHLFLYQPLRSTRKISQRAIKDMDLFTARGYGKRGSDCFGGMCGKRMPEFSGARLYGKRNIDMNQLKCLFVDCENLNKHLRTIDEFANRKIRNDEEGFSD